MSQIFIDHSPYVCARTAEKVKKLAAETVKKLAAEVCGSVLGGQAGGGNLSDDDDRKNRGEGELRNGQRAKRSSVKAGATSHHSRGASRIPPEVGRRAATSQGMRPVA